MTSLSENMRVRVLESLSLIASKEAQLKYQSEAPYVDVPAELFNQWEDCFFPDDQAFQMGFAPEELQALRQFNDVLNQVCSETPQRLPNLDEFVSTTQWRRLADIARTTLSIFAK